MEGIAGGGRCWLLRVKKKAKPAGREERKMVASLLWSAVVGKKKKSKASGGGSWRPGEDAEDEAEILGDFDFFSPK